MGRCCVRILTVGAALLWLASGAAHAARGVYVANPRADAELEAIAPGLALWLQGRLLEAGLAAVRESTRLTPAGAEELGRRAAEIGAEMLLAPEIRLDAGRVRIWLRLFEAGSPQPRAVIRAEGPLAELGPRVEEAAAGLLPSLGPAPGALAPGRAPGLDELAATSRALRHADAGRLARAWEQVAGRLTPMAMGLREEIVALAGDPQQPALERARVLAASGDAHGAWRLVSERATREAQAARPDPRVLVAAGEVQLSLGMAPRAQTFFERALSTEPGLAPAQLGLARALAAQGRREPARRAFARAAELAPSSPLPLLERAALEADPPRERAALWVEAGRGSARRLEVERAERYLERAVEIEPALAAESWRASADLERRLGRPERAAARYAEAERAGLGDVALFRNWARAEWALGRAAEAERRFDQALALDPEDAGSLRGLAALYAESGQASQALPLFERALRLEAGHEPTRHGLARALHASGRSDEALAVLEPLGTAAALQQGASVLEDLGRPAEARQALARAITLEPQRAGLHADLAELLAAEGDAEEAQSRRELAALLEGGPGASGETRPEADGEPAVDSFDSLVASFAGARARRVTLLGVELAAGWKERALDWLHPRVLDREALARSLEAALARHFELGARPELPADTLLAEAAGGLFAFESEASLDAERIALVNQSLAADAVFVARARRLLPAVDGDGVAACAGPDAFELELRMLSGQQADYVGILANAACPSDGLRVFAAWNPRALGVYGVLLALLLSPVLRGWGAVQVRIQLPPRTKGFLSLRVARSPVSAEKKRRQRLSGLRRLLHTLSRYRRHMVGRETVFRWIPARREPYYVTLMGPLKEAASSEIIGHFLEEQRARVTRRGVAKLEFDLQPRECAVEVKVLLDGKAARGARVGLAGDPRSLRYAPDGRAFLYLGVGSYRVLVGSADRVAEVPVEIRSLDKPVPLCVDLGNPERPVFEGCRDAVEPYLMGDFAAAAEALERAGNSEAAHLARAEAQRQRGDEEGAAAEYEAAGRLEEAARLRAGSGGDAAASAQLFERAGDHARAAEAYREAGELAAAAAAYEAAYDYDNALECYREIGRSEKVMELLERTGGYLDAAELAREGGDADRAIRNLQQIARNDSSWGDGRALLGEILAERGDHEIAVESFEEALGAAGGQQAPAGLQERYARLLEKCGEPEKALRAWSAVARSDPSRQDVTKRVAALRQELERSGALGAGTPAPAGELRYERIAELGRGGMGVVYKARDRRLGRLVALKQLPDSLRDHPQAVKLFLREARAAASLNHRNIVTVHDAGEENGTCYITMELLEGLPVDRILARRGRLGARDVARLGCQVAAGLDYAHGQRVVHRDIKTANLFFTRDRCVKIMDFGLAKTIEEVRRNSTLIGGTPVYMAPEQAAGEAVDHRADLYAFGVTLFKLVTGSAPFGDGDLAYHHRHTPAPDARELCVDVPEALAVLIRELMAKNPEERPQSAAEVATRLQPIASG